MEARVFSEVALRLSCSNFPYEGLILRVAVPSVGALPLCLYAVVFNLWSVGPLGSAGCLRGPQRLL